MPDNRLTDICKHIVPLSHGFNPNVPVPADVEQFLRVNIAANHDRLERWIAWLIQTSYDIGVDDRTYDEGRSRA